MSGRKLVLTVVVALVVIGLLIGGGAALYRLGYAHGIASAAASADSDQLPRLYGRGMPGFDGSRVQVWPYGGMMVYSRHMPFGMFGFGGWIFGLVLLGGVIALVWLVVNALTRKRPAEIQATPTHVAPAAIASAPAKPTRASKRTKSS